MNENFKYAAAVTLCLLFTTQASSALAESNTWQLNHQALFIFDNKEWMSGDESGYTDFGWTSPLTLSYEDSALDFQAGIYLSHRYSDNNDIATKPIFHLNYQITEFQQLALGTLPRPTSIHDALLPPVRWLEDPWVEGIQWQLSTEKLKSSFWLDWKTLETIDTAEQFNTGVNIEWQAISNIKLQHSILHDHTDGQITNDPTSKRIYGTFNGLFWHVLEPGNQLQWVLSIAAIASSADINDVKNSGSGTEVSSSISLRQKHWQHRVILSHYSGTPQVTDGFVLYQYEQLDSLELSSSYQADDSMTIKLESRTDWVNHRANTTQTINVIWSISQSDYSLINGL